MHYLRALILLCFLSTSVFAIDPPALRKADAKKILEFMEWREVTVITVQQGINAKGCAAPIFAHVVGLGKRDSNHQQISQTFFYDEEYGWFFYEMSDKSARIWNKDGYREVKPWSTW